MGDKRVVNSKRNNSQVQYRNDGLNLWQRREIKNKEMVHLFLNEGVNSGKPYKKNGVEKNLEYWSKYVNGSTVHFECNRCNNILPFYSFILIQHIAEVAEIIVLIVQGKRLVSRIQIKKKVRTILLPTLLMQLNKI